jgi:hypothetical protein
MQALLMSAYGYNLVGAQYGSGTLVLQVDDLGGLNPADPTAPGLMNGAAADALAAAGVINATSLLSSSNVSAGVSFPVYNSAMNTSRPVVGPLQGPTISGPPLSAAAPSTTAVSCSCCDSMFASFMSNTVGLLYRAFQGGAVDPWTQQVLIAQEAQGLVRAGMDPTQACSKSSTDVAKNAPSSLPASNVSIWVIVAVAVAGIFFVSIIRR